MIEKRNKTVKKKYKVIAQMSAVCFLIAACSSGYDLYAYYSRYSFSLPALMRLLRLLCLVLMGLHLFLRQPIKVGFALLPALYFVVEAVQLIVFERGIMGLNLVTILRLLCWLTMAIGCFLAAGSRGTLSPEKEMVLFLPGILSGVELFMRYGTARLSRMFRGFDPLQFRSWVSIAPIALVVGFLFFAVWVDAENHGS